MTVSIARNLHAWKAGDWWSGVSASGCLSIDLFTQSTQRQPAQTPILRHQTTRPSDTRPQLFRTHTCGELRANMSAKRSRSAAGSIATATTGGAVHRPARPLRQDASGVSPGKRRGESGTGQTHPQRIRDRGDRQSGPAAGRDGQPEAGDRRDRSCASRSSRC